MVRYEDSNLVAEHITDDVLAQLCDLLAPLAPRIHVLDVYSDVYAGSELQAILACATQLCASGALHMLVIHAKDNPDTSTQMLPWDPLHIINSPGDDQLNRFAEPVEVLHLVNVSIDWSNNLYRGLTELSITFTDLVDHLSCSQMVQILTGCPELHRLSLNNLYAVGWDGPDAELRTVNLCRLDYLKLVCSDPKLLAPLLQILRRPTGQWLHVRIGVDDEPEFVEQLQAFFRESRNVSILDVTSGNGTGWFTPICNGLDDSLARLILRGCDFADPDFVHFISTSKNRHRNLWSWLRMIELDYCTVDTASLEWLTCRGFVQVVKLTDCYVRDPGSGVCTLASLSMFTSKLPRHVSVTIENQEGA
ncbi:hypothetical protein FRC08_018344 [Ceratobasidium sp. 394]|nr:hypothetical protein FRC08_018344 [Ceratobasidium sp. 394]